MTNTSVKLFDGTEVTVPCDEAMVIPTKPMSMEETIELLEAHHAKRLAIVANKRKRKKEPE